MGFHDMVSASEAATLSGVSVATLERFAEVGYLTVDSDSDGIPLFSKRELESVFGLNLGGKIPSTVNASPVFSSASPGTKVPVASKAATHMDSLFQLLGSSGERASSCTGNLHQENLHQGPLNHEHVFHEQSEAPPAPASSEAAPLHASSPPSSQESIPTPQERVTTQESAPPRESDESPTGAHQPSSNDVEIVQGLKAENLKLRHVLELQEGILTMREEEIRDLKSQRDWLQRRLERLEEKSDRDQLLLLSETQTIRKLISLQAPRKSTFRLALEWLGLKSDEDRDSLPIRAHATPIELRAPHAQPTSPQNSETSSSPKGTSARDPRQTSGEAPPSRAA
jgi:DNA-binding transcriptional MerR regulator